MKIKKIQRVENSEEIIRVDFEHKGQQAYFHYCLIGLEIGIDDCSYEEEADEDIYALIHDWVEKHIRTETKVYYNNKKINYGGIRLK